MTDPREREFGGTRREDPARFLQELRELRSHAGLGHAELAARAHYPCDAIKAAEAGPALPDLPVLSAYVRGCGGTVAEWEERWRAVTGSPASPLLMARDTRCSEAADAGARVDVVSFTADEQDSDRVIAALNRFAGGMAAAGPASSSQSGAAAPAARPTVPTPAAGNAAEVWTPGAPAGDTDVNTDVWTRTIPAARNTDAWTSAAPVAAPVAADGGLTAAEVVPGPAMAADSMAPDSMAAGTVPDTDVPPPGPAAVSAAGPGVSWPADADPSRPQPPAPIPVVATGRPTGSRPPFPSRTALAVYAAVVLLLVVILIALFA